MFCRQCGCELGEKDRFCFNCGTPVDKAAPVEEPAVEEPVAEEPAVQTPEPVAEPAAEESVVQTPEPVEEPAVEEPDVQTLEPATEPVVEEPAAQAFTEQYERFTEVGSDTPALSHEAFDWNVYTFPSDVPKKPEEVEFDWGIAEGEYKRRPRDNDREVAFGIKPDEALMSTAGSTSIASEEKNMDQGPDRELFGGSVVSGIEDEGEGLSRQAAKIDRFYKEDKRIEEFQKLLDSEYEKVRSGRPLDQDAFNETVASIKERTGDGMAAAAAAPFAAKAMDDMDKTAVFKRVSGLPTYEKPEPEQAEEPATPEEPAAQVPAQVEEPADAEEPASVEEEKPEVPKEAVAAAAAGAATAAGVAAAKKTGGLFDFVADRKMRDETLEMDKEQVESALKDVFKAPTPEETMDDLFGKTDEAKNAAQEELDRQLEDKTAEYNFGDLDEKLKQTAPAEEKPEVPEEAAAAAAAGAVATEAEQKTEEAAVDVEKAADTATAAEGADQAAPAQPATEGKGGTAAIVILTLILIALLALLAVKFVIPGFMADNESTPKAVAMERSEYDSDLNGVIQTQVDENYADEIGDIKYDSSWNAEGLDGTQKLKDNVWYTGKDGEDRYIDEGIVGTVIAYESRKQAMGKNGDLTVLKYVKPDTQLYADIENVLSSSGYEPMKSLTFGEIREFSDNVYCVWVREEKDTDTEKILLIEADEEKMLVTDSIILE